ncbi:MAG: hypothetical protein ACFFCT_00790 [Candidatus Odinarchaeota archaeon]
MIVIASVTLFDLLGSKVLASLLFSKGEISDDFLETVVNEYYTLVQEDTVRSFVLTKVSGHAVSISKVSDVTLVIVVSDSDTFSDEEMAKLQKFQTTVALEILNSSVRDFKNYFPELADRNLRIPLNICFVTLMESTEENKSEMALDALFEIKDNPAEQLTDVIKIGPFAVRVMRMNYSTLVKAKWTNVLLSIELFALIISKRISENEVIQEAVHKIRDESSSRIIVIPGSDGDLEAARNLEMIYGIDLCDTVSPRPVNLLLSAMAYGGFSEMHPELAIQRWQIEPLSRQSGEPQEETDEEIGHQAFFVVDRRTGEAVYSYYYDERSRLLEIAPNIVAAISSFKIDQSGSTETSVFRTGDLSYITIERNEYVFTLITGKGANVESLRSKFSFLPDLFLDEIPEPSKDPTDLFRSPLFTLKLLATLPPVQFPGRVAPTQKRALIWDRFEHPPVRDFLEAVWYRLNGSLTMSKLSPGKGSELILGAIHLLYRLGAIECSLHVLPEDIPILTGVPDEEVLSLYEGLENILAKINGKLNIQNIASVIGIQTSVLLAVFAELHKREIISFSVE